MKYYCTKLNHNHRTDWRRRFLRMSLTTLLVLIVFGSSVLAQAPTQSPQVDLPTASPTNNTNATTTEPPSAIPTERPTTEPTPEATTPTPTPAPSKNATKIPTALPTGPPPTQLPTNAPSVRPSAAPSSPAPTATTDAPTQTPTAVPKTPQKESVTGITITYGNVQELTDRDAFQDTTAAWFDAYFNGDRRLRQQQRRGLQPSNLATVSNMNSIVDITGQKATQDGNTITYTHTMEYDATSDAPLPKELVLLPYQNATYKAILFQLLRGEVPGFQSLSGISEPQIISSSPTPPPVEPETNESGLGLGAIIGISVGGGVALLILLFIAYHLCNRSAAGGGGSGSRYDDGYKDADYQPPPSQFNISANDDIISTMDDPTIAKVGSGNMSAYNYGDQSVASMDYDYTKAYLGGGEASVVSSAGGTLGDNTRQTAGDVAAGSAAARAALGASSFESEAFRNSSIREEVLVINAPAGKLGVVIDTPDDGAPVVHAVKDSSVIADQIQVGDKLIAVDDDDVRSMTAIKVSKLISKKSANPVRRLTIVRTVPSNP